MGYKMPVYSVYRHITKIVKRMLLPSVVPDFQNAGKNILTARLQGCRRYKYREVRGRAKQEPEPSATHGAVAERLQRFDLWSADFYC